MLDTPSPVAAKPASKLACFVLTRLGNCRVEWTKPDGAAGRAWLWLEKSRFTGEYRFEESDAKQMPRAVAEDLELELLDLDHARHFEGIEKEAAYDAVYAAHHCEGCDEVRDAKAYQVTSHEGVVSAVRYCDDCRDLAKCDWNGETAAIASQVGA
jgi:hypothetical protein